MNRRFSAWAAAESSRESCQYTVKTCGSLVPPLAQPRSPLLPEGVFTTTLKVPGPGIMEEVMVTVSSELLTTSVARVVPLKITTEEETKRLPVAVSTKLDGKCAKTSDAGEIESRTGTGRALPQRGFTELHPSSSDPSDIRSTTGSTVSNERASTVRNEVDTTECNLPTAQALIIGPDFSPKAAAPRFAIYEAWVPQRLAQWLTHFLNMASRRFQTRKHNHVGAQSLHVLMEQTSQLPGEKHALRVVRACGNPHTKQPDLFVDGHGKVAMRERTRAVSRSRSKFGIRLSPYSIADVSVFCKALAHRGASWRTDCGCRRVIQRGTHFARCMRCRRKERS